MNPTRRDILKKVSAGAAGLILFNNTVSANNSERVIVHPASNRPDHVVDLLNNVGAESARTYDNFDFVSSRIPIHARENLERSQRVEHVESDIMVYASRGNPHRNKHDSETNEMDSDSEMSVTNNQNNAQHPEQEPNWGWERIDTDVVDETGDGVGIAVLDTGVADHTNLEIVEGINFTDEGDSDDYMDYNGHGTHVAGIASALDDGEGVVGVAPEADLYGVKVLREDGGGYMSWIASGVDWCITNNIPVINMSFGANSTTHTLDSAIEQAKENGHLLIGAAGNEGNNQDGECEEDNVLYPAAYEDVIAVSAMNQEDELAEFSSVGEEVDILAPGNNIRSTYTDNSYETLNGTSMSTPFVAGTVALCLELDSDATYEDIYQALADGSEVILDSCEEGNGLLNVPMTLNELANEDYDVSTGEEEEEEEESENDEEDDEGDDDESEQDEEEEEESENDEEDDEDESEEDRWDDHPHGGPTGLDNNENPGKSRGNGNGRGLEQTIRSLFNR